MTLFLTGATGFVGTEVLTQLISCGYNIRCLIRAGTEKKLSAEKSVEIVTGDVTNPETLAGKMTGCDAVIHLVGIIREFPRQGITFEKIHYEASKNVIEEAKRAGIKHFLHMSALGTKAEAQSNYHKTKYKAEQYLIQSGLTFTIFRPSVIFGPKDAFVNMLAGMIRLCPIVPVIGSGRYKLQPVAVENVAQGFCNAVNNPKAYGKTYEVGGPEPFEYNQLLNTIAKVLNRKIMKVNQPIFLMKPIVRIMENFQFFPLTSDQLLMLPADNICSSELFSRDLDVQLIPFAEGIKKWLA